MTDRQATPALMIQGTGSNVGKSLLVAGLCRLFADRGLRVVPFKPQNMSNNAGVTVDGGEIGRAQMLQARAARVAPTVHMNPVLLKPEAETGAQVVVQGRRYGTLAAPDYGRHKAALMPKVLESFEVVACGADLVLIEGAGSPAETNLRAGDIANMGFAEAAEVPVVLVGDIERGGVIASLVGTHVLLDAADRGRVQGFLINRFRGDPTLFDGGITEIVSRTGWPSFGVVPHFAAADQLPAEDALGLTDAGPSRAEARAASRLRIAVPRLSRIANFDDLDPLRLTPGVEVVIVPPGRALPGDAALIIVPGSKATVADLEMIRREGWDVDITAHRRRGGRVLGLCGGYQMLGRTIADPDGVEGPPATVGGLGLLDVETVLAADKTTRPVAGIHVPTGLPIEGYEIHCGATRGQDTARPFAAIGGRSEGALSSDGRVAGTYVHGLFAGDRFRAAFLAGPGEEGSFVPGSYSYDAAVEAALDGLAAHLAVHCDVGGLLRLAEARVARVPRRRKAG